MRWRGAVWCVQECVAPDAWPVAAGVHHTRYTRPGPGAHLSPVPAHVDQGERAAVDALPDQQLAAAATGSAFCQLPGWRRTQGKGRRETHRDSSNCCTAAAAWAAKSTPAASAVGTAARLDLDNDRVSGRRDMAASCCWPHAMGAMCVRFPAAGRGRGAERFAGGRHFAFRCHVTARWAGDGAQGEASVSFTRNARRYVSVNGGRRMSSIISVHPLVAAPTPPRPPLAPPSRATPRTQQSLLPQLLPRRTPGLAQNTVRAKALVKLPPAEPETLLT